MKQKILDENNVEFFFFKLEKFLWKQNFEKKFLKKDFGKKFVKKNFEKNWEKKFWTKFIKK